MLELGLFYIAATVSLVSTIMAVTRYNAAHALIYLIISLLASAIIFYLVGAPFAAVLEVVIYAGAIMVLFVFVIMMLNLGASGDTEEHALLNPSMWIGPSILCAVLFFEIVYILSGTQQKLSRAGDWSQGCWSRTIWSLCVGGGACLNVVASGAGWCLSPRATILYRCSGARQWVRLS